MRSSVVFCLAVSFAMFGFDFNTGLNPSNLSLNNIKTTIQSAKVKNMEGLSLKCYSCPDGSMEKCTVQLECNQGDDSCLKLKSGETTYTTCMRHADCDFRTLASRYFVPEFTFSCCQSKLCNGETEKSGFQKFLDLIG